MACTAQTHSPKFPATKTVHSPNGPVAACDKHARQLVGLAGHLGSHVGVTDAAEGAECPNCVNAEKAKAEGRANG